MELNIKEILRFYDEVNPENAKHVSAITGLIGEDFAIAVLCHYLHSTGLLVTVRNESCTEGMKKGKWLDKWLFVKSSDKNWLFQVEVKNWSAHSIGGKHLPLDATDEQIQNAKITRWAEQWDEENGKFRDAKVNKVLSVMRSPIENCIVKPLIVYWFVIHPTGKSEPFFEVKTKSHFERAFVFSVSDYLRSLPNETINVDVPRIEERISIIKRLFNNEL